MGWKRAARTDKGVHAIANVINCKLNIDKCYITEEEESTELDKEKENPLTKLEFKKKLNFSKLINKINSYLTNVKVFCTTSLFILL